MKELKARQRQRTDTAARWAQANPLLLRGEIGYESDTGRFKFGDGATRWSTLPYRGGVATVNGTPPDASGDVQVSGGGGETHSLTVRTQEEFDAMAASADWLGATSVLLCGAFAVPSGAGLLVPASVLVLDGAPGSEIFAVGSVTHILRYETPPTGSGRRVAGITVRGTSSSTGFSNMGGLTNCTALGCSVGFLGCTTLVNCRAEVSSTGFSGCERLTACHTHIMRGSICTGFSNSRHLVNCSVRIDRSTYGRGFDTCNFLCSCTADVVGTSVCVGYNNCSYTTCCARGEMSANGQTWSGTTTKRCDNTCDL